MSSVQKGLVEKYAPSQGYYYAQVIAEIVAERRCTNNIEYEDVEYVCDDEENLKRFYLAREFPNKLFSFKEYYFYHEDCPRIFLKEVEQAYAKWQDRKRDNAYKKLKLAYNDSQSSFNDPSHDGPPISHFLLDISDYNPRSHKYYLNERHDRLLDRTHNELQSIRDGLSRMLSNISSLSAISTLAETTPPRSQLFKKASLSEIRRSTDKATHQLSSSSSSFAKLNFKKKPLL